MSKVHSFLLIFISFCCPIEDCKAQNVIDLLGKPISDIEVYQELYALVGKQKKESYKALKNRYSIKYESSGIDYIFNYNGTLVGITFYDSGSRYKRYSDELPMNLKFSMFLTDIKRDLAKFQNMELSKGNPFKGIIDSKNWNTSIYFKDYFVNVINISLKPEAEKLANQKNMNKWGIRLLNDGKCVKGDCFEGNGEMIWGDSVVTYRGNWQDGLPHGKGLYSDKFGRTYSGDFKFGFLWGNGRMNYQGNYTYTGEFQMGLRQGKGLCKFANGMKYQGRYIQDVMNGIGKFYLNKTDYYEGEMLDNKFNGWGKLNNNNGYHEGYFKDGLPNGKGEQFNTQSISGLEGTWVNGKKEGEFIQRDPFGNGQKVFFKNDELVPKPNPEVNPN